jgi:hypothetical protein
MWEGYRVGVFLALAAGAFVRDYAAVDTDACYGRKNDGYKEERRGESIQGAVRPGLKNGNVCIYILEAVFRRFT